MANTDNENGFHGDRFLLDAKDTRQYAIRYENGRPRPPIQVFAQDQREAQFKPNETIFAFDDEIETKVSPNGTASIAALAFQITTDATGKPNNLKSVGVEYELSFLVGATSVDVTYKLTAQSQRDLAENGFDTAFPKNFTQQLDPNASGINRSNGRTTIAPSLLKNLPFPPQQDGGAYVARMSVEASSSPATPEPAKPQPTTQQPAPNTQPVANQPAPANQNRTTGDFNRTATSNPAIPAPPERPKIPDSALEQALRAYGVDLTERAQQGKLDPVVGRDAEVIDSIKVLSRRKQASVCFTGDAGVGKSAMFSGVAQYIANDQDVPDALRGARVIELDLQAMNAGAKFRGQFEERLKPIIDGLKEREGYFKGRKVILAIDEIHSQLTAGKAEGGSDAGNMMKPFLVSKGISVMGTTTSEEYRKHIEKDNALARRFEQKVLSEPNKDATLYILEKLWPGIKAHHGLVEDLPQEDMEYIVNMTNRYAPSESQPAKGEKALDMAAASAKFRHSNVIEKEDIISAIAQMSKLSVGFLNSSDHERFLQMKTELPKEVLGQPGIQRVVAGLVGSRSGLNDPNQPWASFVFQGPTGTGKTELCKALSRYLFGTEDALIQQNMGEYAAEHSVSRLIGAPPGYVGFDSAEPALTEKIRQRPYSILLLDEIEKAHPKVFDVLLPILNDGKMTDNQGKTVLFNNVIVVMTTNLGAKEAMALLKGGSGGMELDSASGHKTPEEQEAALSKVYEKARGQFFRPEMVNRIEELGGFVTFIPLAPEVIHKLVDREVEKVNKRISDQTGAGLKGVTLEVGQAAKEQLAEEGYKPDMGARPLRKVVREKIANPLGEWLMGNKEKVLKFAAENGGAKLVIKSLPKKLGDDLDIVLTTATPALAAAASATNDNGAKKAKRKITP